MRVCSSRELPQTRYKAAPLIIDIPNVRCLLFKQVMICKVGARRGVLPVEATTTSHANHSLARQRRTFQELGFILGCVALLFANLEAAIASDDFPSSVTGTWVGEHCGKRTATWGIQMSPSNAYVRETTCTQGACEEADYRVWQVGSSDRKFAIAPHHVPRAPGFRYSFSIVLQYSANGQRLDGFYVAHPRCSTIHLKKVSTDVPPPLSTRSAARLPRPVLAVSAELPPAPPPSSDRVDNSGTGRRQPSYECFDVCQPTSDGKTYCTRVCD